MPNINNLTEQDKQWGAQWWSSPGDIDGLKMEWVSGTSLRVTSGCAYIESMARNAVSQFAITKAGLSLSASTWYHVYLFLNAGVPDIEIVTTAPATPYSGTARSKTGDTSRRYVGSVLTDGSGNLYRFRQCGNDIKYLTTTNVAPFRAAIFNPANTTKTVVSLSTTIPVTGVAATARVSNPDTAVGYWLGTSDDGTTTGIFVVSANVVAVLSVAVSLSQDITYAYQSVATSGGAIDIVGYTYER